MSNLPVIPSRKAVIQEHKAQGGRIAAVFPIHYPRALFRAYGVLPVEVWGPPGMDPTLGNAHLQSYTCDVVRLGLSFLLSGGLEAVDYIVVPHACDSLQGLGSLLLDFIPQPKPVWPFYLPRGQRESDLAFFALELNKLSDRLAQATGKKPTPDQWLEAIQREERADRLLAEFFKKRRQLALSDSEVYQLGRARGYLPAETFGALVEPLLQSSAAPATTKKPLILSGILPEPAELLTSIEKAGGMLVGDDTVCLGRRFYKAGKSEEPLVRLAQSILSGPPDSTRGSPIAERIGHLTSLVSQTGARGVILYPMKFCEPELFYLPQTRQALQEAGIPSVVIEGDLSRHVPQQVVTRIEAFLEMIP